MSIRMTKEEMALMLPHSLSHYAPVSSAPVNDDMDAERGIVQRLVNGVRWLVELPRRRAVISELSGMSDHELSDIGLSRAELGRVFDPAFMAQRDYARGAERFCSARI